MKIRNTISLWIAAITLSVGMVSGFIVYLEMSEEYYNLIDRELDDLSTSTLSSLFDSDSKQHKSDTDTDRYFIEIITDSGDTVYQSRLAGIVTFNQQDDEDHFVESIDIPYEHLWLDPIDEDDMLELSGDGVLFRVLVIKEAVDGKNYIITVAKPLPFMTEDLKEMREQIIFYSGIATVLILCLSYLLAGRILSPLKTINAQIREIHQTSLSRRIPLGKSQDEIYDLSSSLNLMLERLEHSFEKQREFIGNAAHEIKTPITTLLLGHENLTNRDLPSDVIDDLEKQLDTLRRISLLVKNLLDISRLEQQDILQFDTFDLSELINDILDEFEAMVADKHLTIIWNNESAPFVGDRVKIQRMLINLVDNAINYNEQNGRLTITLTQTKKLTTILISNTGPVIPEDDLPKIFDQFFRVDRSHGSQNKGFGLGLTIVKTIVELHRGTIAIKSSNDDTSITLHFPTG